MTRYFLPSDLGAGMTATASASVYKVVARDYFFSALEGAAFVAALSVHH